MTTETEQKRERVHGMWAAVAERWAEHADYVELRTVKLNAAIFAGVALGPTDRVLDLASGPGGLGIAAAARAGEVVLSDVVPEMVDIAAKRAANAGLTNVTTKVLDLEEIAEADATFDAVLCREGLMFAVDPSRAVGEIQRVLRPGGRVGVSVWGPAPDNPWLSLVLDSVSAQLGHPVPPPGIPGPFALADRDELFGLFRDAGFTDVALVGASVPLHADSFDEWWARTRGVAGPLSQILSLLSPAAVTEIETRLQSAAAPYATANGLDFPGLALVLTAQR